MKIVYVGEISIVIFLYFATIYCYWRIKAYLKANMQMDVVHGVKRKTLKNIIRSMLIQVKDLVMIFGSIKFLHRHLCQSIHWH